MEKRLEMKDIERCLLGTVLIYIVTYLAVSRNGELSFDFIVHTDWARQLGDGEVTIREFLINRSSYPLWHIVTDILYKFVGLNENEAAATSTALFNCFTYWSVNYAWIIYVKVKKIKLRSNIWLWSFLLMIMGPLYMPRYTKFYYLGQGSGNIWHNPTNMAVKGIAVLTFMLIAFLVENVNNTRKTYFLLSILLVISVLEKPSFLQGIIPGLGLYIIIMFVVRRKIKEYAAEYTNFLKIISAFVPAVLIVLLQFYAAFFGGERSGGVGISYGYVLHNYSFNLFHSFLLAFAFPIVVLIIDFKNMIKDIFFQIACCYEFSAWLESVMIYEKGVRALNGNWLWASYLSMFMVWMISVIRFCCYIESEEKRTLKKTISISLGIGVLALQVICGFLYWYNIATGKIIY